MATFTRRKFLAVGTGSVLAAPMVSLAQTNAPLNPDAGVTATEDLMKEHGVLRRCLLLYEAGVERIEHKEEVNIFNETAGLIRKFVEEYHERNEEKYIFPEFERAQKLTELVAVLKAQHEAGRKVTAEILALSTPSAFQLQTHREKLATACQSFIRMYRPHAAREDTVLFMALRTILSPEQVLSLGDRMEEDEKKVLGNGGFEQCVDQVTAIEKRLGIYDLAQFTPKI
jgi:hemerythrin-like domain-containing protein